MPSFGGLASGHRRRRVPPGIADIGQDGGNFVVFQKPTEFGHCRPGRRPIGCDASRAAQHDMQKASRVRLLDDGGPVERGKQACRAFAICRMAPGTFIGINPRADLHYRPVRRAGHALILIAVPTRRVLQICRNGLKIGFGHVRCREIEGFGHRTVRRAGTAVAGLQIGCDLVDRPAANAAAWIAGDIRGKPALQRIAPQPFTCLIPAEKFFGV